MITILKYAPVFTYILNVVDKYNECFAKIKIKLKSQKQFRPWITLGRRKSFKKKGSMKHF